MGDLKLVKVLSSPSLSSPLHSAHFPSLFLSFSFLVSPTNPLTHAIYKPLGCYKDEHPNVMPNLVINLRDSIDWKNLNKTIDTCAQYVHKYYSENKVFGVQFYGECWTGPGAENTYMKYGAADNCYKGVGAKHSIYVYKFR